MKTIAKTASGLRRYPLWLYAVLAVITLVGIGAWVYQLMNGHHVTDMSNATSFDIPETTCAIRRNRAHARSPPSPSSLYDQAMETSRLSPRRNLSFPLNSGS